MRQLAEEERPGTTCRAPDSAAELQELRREHAGRLTVLPLDVTDESTIEGKDENRSCLCPQQFCRLMQ